MSRAKQETSNPELHQYNFGLALIQRLQKPIVLEVEYNGEQGSITGMLNEVYDKEYQPTRNPNDVLQIDVYALAEGVHGAGKFYFDHAWYGRTPNSSAAYGLRIHNLTSVTTP